jgi:hypothetical protein
MCHPGMDGGFIMSDLGVMVCVTLVNGQVVAVRVSSWDVPLGVMECVTMGHWRPSNGPL